MNLAPAHIAVTSHPDWRFRAQIALDLDTAREPERLWQPSGETVLILQTTAGEVWLHTKDFYPSGVFRLPTGGVKQDEHPDHAAVRELCEETGLCEGSFPERLALTRYEDGAGHLFPFCSFLYRVAGVDTIPKTAEPEEGISGWRAVTPAELRAVAGNLRALPDDWAGWGAFRAVTHEVVAAIFLSEV
jgi:8-oxo-dGTP pyrophosphatase MutT (NUDIX family)